MYIYTHVPFINPINYRTVHRVLGIITCCLDVYWKEKGFDMGSNQASIHVQGFRKGWKMTRK